MKYFSTFSGIGGFELGIQQAWEKKYKVGIFPKCVGYSEIDKYAIQVYNKQFNHKNYGDITKINAEELPDFDLLVGGFPCQSFSIAGKRGGFEDTRGTMFFELARILRTKKPRLFVFENVKGLLSHDGGRTFATIIQTIDELGYDCQWQLLNSKNHGVPQNRERVFIVGHLRGTSRPEVFPIEGSNPKALKQIIGGGQGNRVYDVDGVSTTQASQAGGQGAKTGLYAITRSRPDKSYKENNISPTVRNGDKDDIRAVLTPDRLNKRQNGRRIKEDGEPAFTCTAQDRHGILKDSKIRRLTPKECERLQGFPDDWTKVGVEFPNQLEIKTINISDTQRYKMCGNAVTVNVIKDIFIKLIQSL